MGPEEIAADKTLALFSRALARDLVDVNALAERFGRGRLLDLAAEKDRGFDRRHFAEALARAAGRPDNDFVDLGVGADKLDQLRDRAAEWRRELL